MFCKIHVRIGRNTFREDNISNLMLQQFRRRGIEKKRLKIREIFKAKSKVRTKQILEPILVKTVRNTFHKPKMSNLVLRQFMTLGWKVIIWK